MEIVATIMLGILVTLIAVVIVDAVILETKRIPYFISFPSFLILFISIIVLVVSIESRDKKEWEERERAEQKVCDKMWGEFVKTEKLADYFIWVEECK